MQIDDNEIMRIVNNLKNKSSYGYDCISNLLLKLANNEFIKPLTLIINEKNIKHRNLPKTLIFLKI